MVYAPKNYYERLLNFAQQGKQLAHYASNKAASKTHRHEAANPEDVFRHTTLVNKDAAVQLREVPERQDKVRQDVAAV